MPEFESLSSDAHRKEIENKIQKLCEKIGRIDSRYHSRIVDINTRFKKNEVITKEDVDFVNKRIARFF